MEKTPSIKAKLAAEAGPAKAVHLTDQDETQHIVGIGNLSVLIVPDGKYWFAQGLEIDYGVQGDSLEEAKALFGQGLSMLIDQQLALYGNIEKILHFAPSKILLEATRKKSSIKFYSRVSIHEVSQAAEDNLPFAGIDFHYVEQQAAA